MAMNMRKAFNKRMLTKLERYEETSGYFDTNNDYIKGSYSKDNFYGVIIAGNKFSQFDEGISRKPTAGGERYSQYKTLYVSLIWPSLSMKDYVGFNGTYYNILQKSDEVVYGFNSYIIEKAKNWQPT